MIGINLSGAEFGKGHRYGTDYIYPSAAELAYYAAKGVEMVRLPFKWERMQKTLDGDLDPAELGRLKQFLANADAVGVKVIIDLHNYGRYGGNAIGTDKVSVAQFADFWSKMATAVGNSPALLGYDLMNEPHDMPSKTAWPTAAQAAVDAIRAVDTDTKIYVSGDGWSSARMWTAFNDALLIKDPSNKIVYQAHIYFDNDGAGIYDQNYDGEKAYATMGMDRIRNFTDWLAKNNVEGFIGEFAVPGNDPRWLTVLDNFLAGLEEMGLDGTYWGGGAWFGNYALGLRYGDGTDRPQLDVLEKYLVDPLPATITGTADADILGGGRGGDVIDARGGDDLIKASNGTDVIDGGSGNDTVTYAAAYKGVTVDLTRGVQWANTPATAGLSAAAIAADTTAKPAGDVLISIENVVGTRFDDVLIGSAAANVLTGGEGNDVLIGGAGADTLDGGKGDDTADYSDSRAGIIVALAGPSQRGGDAEGDILIGVENVIGTDFDDRMSGDAGSNTLSGGKGNDWFSAGVAGGTDTYDGGDGFDTFDASGGTKGITLSLAEGGSKWIRLVSIEALIGTDLRDMLTGDDDANRLVGNGGADVLDGRGGVDVMEGGAGADTYYVDDARDVIVEVPGTEIDTVYTTADYRLPANVERIVVQSVEAVTVAGNDLANTITGNDTASSLSGEGGNDTINGGSGSERLYGGSGNDRLNGAAGLDQFWGGTGADMFSFGAGDLDSGAETIWDFARGEGDKIDLSKIDANTALAGDQKFAFVGASAFSGKAGELRVVSINGGFDLMGDVNGDGRADFVLHVMTTGTVLASDIYL